MNYPNQYQVIGFNAQGKCTHAGVHGFPRLNLKSATRNHRKWLAWREQYLREHPGNYPLRETTKTVGLVIHPIGKPKERKVFTF